MITLDNNRSNLTPERLEEVLNTIGHNIGYETYIENTADRLTSDIRDMNYYFE